VSSGIAALHTLLHERSEDFVGSSSPA